MKGETPMRPTDVSVEEITSEAGKLVTTTQPKGVNLGNITSERRVDDLIGKIRQQGGRVFLIEWKGDKIPEGVEIGGYIITWTQSGIVSGKTVDGPTCRIGTYDRLEEFGGESRDHHRMLVYLFRSASKLQTP